MFVNNFADFFGAINLVVLVAEEKKVIAVQKSKDMEVQNAEIVKEKTEAEAALEEALPALEAARTALDDLNKVSTTTTTVTTAAAAAAAAG